MSTENSPCPNCDAVRLGPFCQACGQPEIHAGDLGLRHAGHHVFHELFHLDGRIWRSLKLLFLRPGQLSLDFLEGRRQRHLHPVRIFLVFAGAFFLLANPIVMNLDHISKRDPSGRMAGRLKHLATREGTTVEALTAARSKPLQSVYKAGHLASVLLLGGAQALLFRRRFRQIGQHLVVAAHNVAAGLALYLPSALLLGYSSLPMAPALGGVAVVHAYGFLALRRVHGGGRIATFLKVALLFVLHLAWTMGVMFWAMRKALI